MLTDATWQENSTRGTYFHQIVVFYLSYLLSTSIVFIFLIRCCKNEYIFSDSFKPGKVTQVTQVIRETFAQSPVTRNRLEGGDSALSSALIIRVYTFTSARTQCVSCLRECLRSRSGRSASQERDQLTRKEGLEEKDYTLRQLHHLFFLLSGRVNRSLHR